MLLRSFWSLGQVGLQGVGPGSRVRLRLPDMLPFALSVDDFVRRVHEGVQPIRTLQSADGISSSAKAYGAVVRIGREVCSFGSELVMNEVSEEPQAVRFVSESSARGFQVSPIFQR